MDRKTVNISYIMSPPSRHIIILGAFCIGFFLGNKFPEKVLYIECKPILTYTVLFTLAVLLSGSVYGLVLLPACSAVYGLYAETQISVLYSQYMTGGITDIVSILIAVTFLSAFLVVAVNGMKSSSLLCTMLAEGRTIARSKYTDNYLNIIMTAAAVAVVIYLYL